MAGYNGYSKSNNAVAAEESGLMVASVFAAKLRREHGVGHCTANDVAECFAPSEWHHTSKYYNRVNYYDPADATAEAVADVKAHIALRLLAASLFARLSVGGTVTILMSTGEKWHTVARSEAMRYVDHLAAQAVRGHGGSPSRPGYEMTPAEREEAIEAASKL